MTIAYIDDVVVATTYKDPKILSEILVSESTIEIGQRMWARRKPNHNRGSSIRKEIQGL